ncbi:MAG: hypothetical protein ACT4PU_05195 [Planctomycetota bacterium]
MKVVAGLLNLSCGLFGFALGATAVGEFVPWPSDLGLRAKLEYVQAHRDEYDTLIFGTSFTHHGLLPQVLDAEFGRLGLPQHSLNLAVAGMNFYELDHLLRTVLEHPPAGLRRIFVETVSWREPPDHWIEGEFQARAVNWHTPARTRDVLRVVPGWPREPASWTRAWIHLRLMLQRLVNHAQGPALVAALLGRDEPYDYLRPEDLAVRQGFRRLDVNDGEEFAERRRRFGRGLADYQQRIAGIDSENLAAPGQPPDRRAVAAQRDVLLATGAQVVWFVPPADSAAAEIHALRTDGILPELLSFNSPGRFPELYSAEHRFDRGHLNERGGRVFSLLFAEQAAPLLKEVSALENSSETGR